MIADIRANTHSLHYVTTYNRSSRKTRFVFSTGESLCGFTRFALRTMCKTLHLKSLHLKARQLSASVVVRS